MTAPWCQWCDDIGHDEADCPEYEEDDPREVAAEKAIDEGYGRRRA